MSILLKSNLQIQWKILSKFQWHFHRNRTTLKFVKNHKRSQVTKQSWEERENLEGVTRLFHTILASYKITKHWYWHKNRHMIKWNRLTRNKSNWIYGQLSFDQLNFQTKYLQNNSFGEKTQGKNFFNEINWKIKQPPSRKYNETEPLSYTIYKNYLKMN